MIVKHNVDVGKISWLHVPTTIKMGKVSSLFYPETVDELLNICKTLQNKKENYFVFGHMSNSYFKPNFTPPNLIITSKLRSFENKDNIIICEAGVPIKQLARLMVDEGIEGYAGLWDLPGTVAAAVYGNAGCYGCEMSSIFHSAEILRPDGMVSTVYAKDIGFSRRNSKIKSGEIKGIILRVILMKRKGSLEQEKAKASKAHIMRLQTQPGPQNNLGSCFMSGKRTIWYRIVQKLVLIFLRVKRKDLSLALYYELKLLGQKSLIPYLFNMNRFIWKDEKAYELFDVYVRLYKKLYKNARLEINIFE